MNQVGVLFLIEGICVRLDKALRVCVDVQATVRGQ